MRPISNVHGGRRFPTPGLRPTCVYLPKARRFTLRKFILRACFQEGQNTLGRK